jgi:hypothetical protein
MFQSVGDYLTQAVQAQSGAPLPAIAMSQIAGGNEGLAQSSRTDSTLQAAAISQAHGDNHPHADDLLFGSPVPGASAPPAPVYQGARDFVDEFHVQSCDNASESAGKSKISKA